MDSSATSTETTGLQRHPEPNFDDGDIILQAPLSSPEQSRQMYLLFCVHTTVLSAHSHVFSNLFADASASPELTYVGISLIMMSDDATCLSHLPLYIYDPG